MKKIIQSNIFGAVALIAIISAFLFAAYQSKRSEISYIGYSAFLEKAHNGEIKSVTLTDGAKIRFTQNDGEALCETDNPRNATLKETLLLLNIEVTEGSYVSASSVAQSGFSLVFMVGAFFVAFRFINKSGGKAAMSLNVQAADATGENVINFEHIAGNEEAKESVSDIVDFIRNPDKYSKYGARMPRGIIFYGPPGTGKTLMAKAIAGEAGVPFYAVSGSDFVQMYVGVGAGRVRELFKKARESGKAVIFIDEIDAIGKTRSGNAVGGNDERDQTLNALLTEMSGFSTGEGIVVIAATNRLDTLDEALLRPGRFDRQVEISLPDLNSRKRILEYHIKNKPLSKEIDITDLAKQTVYFSGAMLENLLNEAAIGAAKKGSGTISREDLDTAYYTVIAGSEKKDRSQIKERDRQITAYHESGHALATKLLSPDNTVSKITIIPSTKGAGGFCVNIPPDKMYYTKMELEAQVIMLLSGRAAEEIIFGENFVTTGASNDIEKATGIIKQYVTKYGMSKTAGLAPLSEPDMYKEYALHMDRLYNAAKTLISTNLLTLGNIANALLVKETLNEAELDELMETA